MRTDMALSIHEPNLSLAWLSATKLVLDSPGHELGPLVVSFDDDLTTGVEDLKVRSALDDILKKKDWYSCETVGGTIFPVSLWNPKLSRNKMYARFYKLRPFIRSHRANMHGTYFERMIAYGLTKRDKTLNDAGVLKGIKTGVYQNQLEGLLTTFNGGSGRKPVHRRSALQALVYNPMEDYCNLPQRGFPCMQQFSLNPDSKKGTLTLNAFYATQFMLQKAYGNYLGLRDLGRFLAHEMKLKLARVNCIAGVAMLGTSPTLVKTLLKRIEKG